MKTKYENIIRITLNYIRKQEDLAVTEGNRLARVCSPWDGAGWGHKLPNFLRDSYKQSLNELLDKLDDVVVNGRRMDELQEVKDLISSEYIKSIKKITETHPFSAVHKTNSYSHQIIGVLQKDIESDLAMRISLWTEQMKINKMKFIKELQKLALGYLLKVGRLFVKK